MSTGSTPGSNAIPISLPAVNTRLSRPSVITAEISSRMWSGTGDSELSAWRSTMVEGAPTISPA